MASGRNVSVCPALDNPYAHNDPANMVDPLGLADTSFDDVCNDYEKTSDIPGGKCNNEDRTTDKPTDEIVVVGKPSEGLPFTGGPGGVASNISEMLKNTHAGPCHSPGVGPGHVWPTSTDAGIDAILWISANPQKPAGTLLEQGFAVDPYGQGFTYPKPDVGGPGQVDIHVRTYKSPPS